MEKIFVLGLPRTGTTSVCCAALELGLKTAHTAYTKSAIQRAELIADTPIYADPEKLLGLYPNAKFIQLERDLTLWLPSIKQLLQRMFKNVTRADGGFNPHIKRCFTQVFSPFTEQNIANDEWLTQCFMNHKAQIENLFQVKSDQLLTINVSNSEDYQRFCAFVGSAPRRNHFEIINKGGKVTAWNDIKHPLKIDSTRKGKIDKVLY